MKYIKGEYFTWCDSDNFYTNDYIEEKVDYFIKNPRYSILRCDGYIVDSNDLEKPIRRMAYSEDDKKNEKMFLNCLYERNFHFGCAMLRTKDFDAINPKREIYKSREGQNWQLLLPMFYNYLSGYIDKPMFYFVYRSDSVSNRTKTLDINKQIDQIKEYENIIVNTLNSMDIPDDERAMYLSNVHYKYVKIKYMLSCSENEKTLAKGFKNELKQAGKFNLKFNLFTRYLTIKSKIKSIVAKIKK